MSGQKTRLGLEQLEDRTVPSCSVSNFYGQYAASSEPPAIGVETSTLATTLPPLEWAMINREFGLFHGCEPGLV